MKRTCVFVVTMACAATTAFAGESPYVEALRALDRGDYTVALRTLEPKRRGIVDESSARIEALKAIAAYELANDKREAARPRIEVALALAEEVFNTRHPTVVELDWMLEKASAER